MKLLKLLKFLMFTLLLSIANASFANEPAKLFSEVKLYAALANAAYLPEQQATEMVTMQGYQLNHYSNVPGVEVSYFIATNDELKQQIIAVRGTANIQNAIVDISLKLLPDAHAKIALHQGFAQAAEGIYKEVLTEIKPGYRISTTGHSLGGAVAVILAMYLDIDKYPLGHIITFGQPKITNVSGAMAFSHLNLTRVVTTQDLVPLVPPLDIMDINNIDIYWHLGKEIVLHEGADYSELVGVKSMMRATRVVNTQLSQENIEHHLMTEYLSSLAEKTESARLVPYETGIDIFKMFGQ